MNEHKISGLELRTALARLDAAEEAITEVRRTLSALPGESLASPTTPPPGRPSAPPTAPPPMSTPGAPGPQVAPPPLPHFRQPPPPPPQPPRKPPKPPLPLEQKVMRGIAIGGAVITLIGVALLIALAIQLGLLGPLARVIGTAALAAVLLGIGLRQITLKTPNLTGGNALVITSHLIYSLLVVTLVHWLEWWPELTGAVVLLMIHGVYLGIARRLRMAWLSHVVAAVGGLLALAYVYPAPETWPIMLLPLITVFATYRSGWGWSRMIAGLAMVLLHLSLLGTWDDNLGSFSALLATVSALTLFWVNLQDPLPETSLARPRNSRWLVEQELPTWPHRTVQLVLATALLPLIAFAAGVTPWMWLSPIAAAGFLLLALRYRDPRGTTLSLSVLPLTFLPLWWMSRGGSAPLRDPEAALVLIIFLILGVLLVWWMSTRENIGRAPWICWLIATLLLGDAWGYGVVFRVPSDISGYPSLILALLLAALLIRVLLSAPAFRIFSTWEQVAGGIATLHLSMLVVVTLSTNLDFLLGDGSPAWTGYYLGHALISIIWMVLAAWVLLAHTPLKNNTALGIGVILALSATVKLVFFDLSALSGVPRVFAFLVCGVVLLAIATIRSRRTPVTEEAPDPVG